jgi:Do/DeqQ family serine protease
MNQFERSVLPRFAAFVIACLAAPLALAQSNPSREMPSLAPMIEEVSPAVVSIAVTSDVEVRGTSGQDELLRRFFDFDLPPEGHRQVEGAGSGVIVDAEHGYILTNHHVIESAEKITVTLLDNRSLHATVLGSDEGSDIAVIKVDPGRLKALPLGDSDKLRVGDYVVALGNPFGFGHTVTSGIVSALGRSGLNREAYEDFIQTDASINPGNSGGALVNLNGELVGINSAIISRSGGNVGIGFAIPVNQARAIMDQLIEYGAVSRGLLGVNISDISPETAEIYGLPDNSGALVARVSEGSAAEAAGIQINDVIISVNGMRLRDSGALRNAIGLMRPGERVTVGLIRDGKQMSVTAALGKLETTTAAVEPPAPEDAAELDPVFQGAEIVTNESGVEGLLVARVDQGSPAAESGLKPGDIITKVNRIRVRSMAEAKPILDEARSIILEVQRGNRNQVILMR